MTVDKLLFYLLLITGLTIATLYWQQDHLPFKLPTLTDLQSFAQHNQLAESQSVQSVTQQAQEQLQATGEKFQSAASSVQQVLGAAVQVNEDETKSAPEKALDYGKYLYCQQVVNEFEKHKSLTASPAP